MLVRVDQSYTSLLDGKSRLQKVVTLETVWAREAILL